ncbi:MAG: hypothetical protein KatS3mg077_0755 [Candidatus Binatia bacterium]|nr:MAG: hypothetical protein KatS3mg077_0755 [Candidatus Binatia bacterium]
MALEIEAKFHPEDERVWHELRSGTELGDFVVRPKGREKLVSSYLDTPDWSLFRAGVALRLRRKAGVPGCELTAKWTGSVNGSIHQREELTVALRRPPRLPIRRLPPPLETRLAATVAKRPLAPILVTRVDRALLSLFRRERLDSEIAEIALDRVVTHGANKRPTLQYAEIEVELRSGPPSTLQELATLLQARYSLTPEPTSKFELGLRALYRGVGHEARGEPSALCSIHMQHRQSLLRWQAADAALRLEFDAVTLCGLQQATKDAFFALLEHGEQEAANGLFAAIGALGRANLLLAAAEDPKSKLSPDKLAALRAQARRVVRRALGNSAYMRALIALERAVYGKDVPVPR